MLCSMANVHRGLLASRSWGQNQFTYSMPVINCWRSDEGGHDPSRLSETSVGEGHERALFARVRCMLLC